MTTVDVPIKVNLGAAVFTPHQRHALADLPTHRTVAVTQDPDCADLQAEDGERVWHLPADGGSEEVHRAG